jgi:outer membrane protein TolC
MKTPSLFLATLLATAALLRAGEPLGLSQAQQLAAEHSRAAQLARLKVEEAGAGLDNARSQRYPLVTVFGTAAYMPDPFDVTLKQGSLTGPFQSLATQLGFGSVAQQVGAFPSQDLMIAKGRKDIYIGGVSLLQPLSQQWRIGSGVAAARSERETRKQEEHQVSSQLRYGVEELFVGILVEHQHMQALEALVTGQRAKLLDAEHAASVGELLDDAVLGLRAELTQAETSLLRSRQQLTKLGLQLADLIGRPGEPVTDVEAVLPVRQVRPLGEWLAAAERNPERLAAAAVVAKAVAGERASRQANIPDLGFFATGLAQDGIAYLPARTGFVGLVLKWDIFDAGRTSSEVRRSSVQRRMAEVNRDRVGEEIMRQVRAVYLDLEHADEILVLAGRAADYRRRAAQLARQSAGNGLALRSRELLAEADQAEAESDLYAAGMQRHLALLRLNLLTGGL